MDSSIRDSNTQQAGRAARRVLVTGALLAALGTLVSGLHSGDAAAKQRRHRGNARKHSGKKEKCRKPGDTCRKHDDCCDKGGMCVEAPQDDGTSRRCAVR